MTFSGRRKGVLVCETEVLRGKTDGIECKTPGTKFSKCPQSRRDSERTLNGLACPYFQQFRSGLGFVQFLVLYLVIFSLLCPSIDGCSSRSTPKPRLPSPTMRPNITFQTYSCPPAYSAWYCLNGATCFTVKIGVSILYNCKCAEGYRGQRCKFKDLDESYVDQIKLPIPRPN